MKSKKRINRLGTRPRWHSWRRWQTRWLWRGELRTFSTRHCWCGQV